jgi:hypothetical protein
VLKGKWWSKICCLVGVEEERMDVQLSSEHRSYRWIKRDEVDELVVMTEGQREVMRKGFDVRSEG